MYKLTKNGDVLRLADKVMVPQEEANRDWQEYQAWLVAGNSPEPAETQDEVKASALASINASCERAIVAIQSGYPSSEVLSWPKQEAEARSYVADSSAPTPLLDALAEARGIDKTELAARVILKADAFAKYSGTAIGKRQALEDALIALPAGATADQIAAIAW